MLSLWPRCLLKESPGERRRRWRCATTPRRVFSSDRACKHTGERRSLARIQTNNPSAHTWRRRWGWSRRGRTSIAVIVRGEEIEQTRVRTVTRGEAKRFKRLVAEGVTHLADTAKRPVHHHWAPLI